MEFKEKYLIRSVFFLKKYINRLRFYLARMDRKNQKVVLRHYVPSVEWSNLINYHVSREGIESAPRSQI